MASCGVTALGRCLVSCWGKPFEIVGTLVGSKTLGVNYRRISLLNFWRLRRMGFRQASRSGNWRMILRTDS